MGSWDDPVTGFAAGSEAHLGPYNPATEADTTTLEWPDALLVLVDVDLEAYAPSL